MEPHDKIEAISRLALLRDQGVLTPEEFAEEKRKILSQQSGLAGRGPLLAALAFGIAICVAGLWLVWPKENGGPLSSEAATTQGSTGAPAEPVSNDPLEPVQRALASNRSPESAPPSPGAPGLRKCGNPAAVEAAIEYLQEFYGDVPSFYECGTDRMSSPIAAHQIMCNDEQILRMLTLDTMSWVAAIENATKTELDHMRLRLENYRGYRDYAAQRDACLNDQCICDVLMGENGGVAANGSGPSNPYDSDE